MEKLDTVLHLNAASAAFKRAYKIFSIKQGRVNRKVTVEHVKIDIASYKYTKRVVK